MDFAIVLFAVALLLVLILAKLNAVLALLITSLVTGLLLGMPIAKVMGSINSGIGNTLGGLIMVLSLGAMLGKLVEDSGAAKKIVLVLLARFKVKNIQWAVLFTGILVGIPLFYNAGFVVLIPLVFTIASTTKLPLLYVGIPMAASLSITHGFLPPHPGPLALAVVFKADVGKILLYGLLLSVPIAVVAGIIFPRLMIKTKSIEINEAVIKKEDLVLPSAAKSFFIAALPILFITAGTVGSYFTADSPVHTFFIFLQEPTIALLLSVLITLVILALPITKAMQICLEGVKSIAMIILIIAAGGSFKQILIDSGIGNKISEQMALLQLSPLFLAWLVAALLRIALGSATIAALTASGIVLPMVQQGASPELMVLAVGAGSLMCSHVNDTGFWMFKEYFGLTIQQTLGTWTVMESIISVLGLAGVLLLNLYG